MQEGSAAGVYSLQSFPWMPWPTSGSSSPSSPAGGRSSASSSARATSEYATSELSSPILSSLNYGKKASKSTKSSRSVSFSTAGVASRSWSAGSKRATSTSINSDNIKVSAKVIPSELVVSLGAAANATNAKHNLVQQPLQLDQAHEQVATLSQLSLQFQQEQFEGKEAESTIGTESEVVIATATDMTDSSLNPLLQADSTSQAQSQTTAASASVSGKLAAAAAAASPSALPVVFKDTEIAASYFTRDDIPFSWVCAKCGRKVRQTGVGHKSLVAHVKFIHSNYDEEMRFAITKGDGKISKEIFNSEKTKINIHAHRVTLSALQEALDLHPDRINELKSIEGIDNWTVLAFACHNWNWEAAFELIDRNADVNVANSLGITALMCAANGGHIGVVMALVGAIIDAVDHKGRTALMRACKNHHMDVAEFLVLGGASISLQDKNGLTALDHLTFEEHKQRLKAADVNSAHRYKL